MITFKQIFAKLWWGVCWIIIVLSVSILSSLLWLFYYTLPKQTPLEVIQNIAGFVVVIIFVSAFLYCRNLLAVDKE